MRLILVMSFRISPIQVRGLQININHIGQIVVRDTVRLVLEIIWKLKAYFPIQIVQNHSWYSLFTFTCQKHTEKSIEMKNEIVEIERVCIDQKIEWKIGRSLLSYIIYGKP